jgi:hypothetical protein
MPVFCVASGLCTHKSVLWRKCLWHQGTAGCYVLDLAWLLDHSHS